MVERGFSPGQILLVLAGAASLALGIAAVIATGLDGPLSEPVDEVLGWNHTALLGIIEMAAGVVMILSGLRAGAAGSAASSGSPPSSVGRSSSGAWTDVNGSAPSATSAGRPSPSVPSPDRAAIPRV